MGLKEKGNIEKREVGCCCVVWEKIIKLGKCQILRNI